MKKVELTETQIWFIKKAIDLQDAVLPLEESVMSEEEFKIDYGISKEKVRASLKSLKEKINKP